jgi:N-ethylmaleimide reductase
MTICSFEHLTYSEMEKTPPILSPYKMGIFSLRNRVIMAPLTRRRATDDHTPTSLMQSYYEQRSSAGLIIAEATNISPQAVGYLNTPGIFTKAHIEGWKKITHAVQQKGGIIFLQLWHVGRVSHNLLQPGQKAPVSASAIAVEEMITTPEGKKQMPVPRALETSEIKNIVHDYKLAAINAMSAGFDGIEVHGANGYLPDQFLHDGSNHRRDRYGGSIENRCRLILEIIQACCDAIGSGRVGVRLSPSGINKGMFDSDPVPLYSYLVNELNQFKLTYLQIMEQYPKFDPVPKYEKYLQVVTPFFRKIYTGILMTNSGYNFESGNKIISEGHADLVAFGKLFIANPDLPLRFAKGAALNSWDDSTFYYGGEKGYLDYPFLEP